MAEYDALDRMSRTLRGSNPLPPRSPMGNMADTLRQGAQMPPAAPEPPRPAGPGNPNVPPGGSAEARAFQQARATSGLLDEASAATRAASEAARPGVAPGAAPAAAAPSTASKFFGSADDWKNALKGPADSPHKSLRMTAPEAPGKFAKGVGVLQGAMGAKNAYDGIQEGDSWKAGVGAADAVAGAALFTPAAPVAGAYLGLRGAWDGAQALGGAINDHVLSEGAKDAIGGTINQIGLNTGLWGTDDSAKMQMDAEQRLRGPAQSSAPAAAPSARPDPRNPYADANARKIAESDAQNAAADAQAQAQVQQNREAGGGAPYANARPDLGYGNFDPRTLTNEQAGVMNPRGKITTEVQANGVRSFSGNNVAGQVSYHDKDGTALPGGGLRGNGFANVDSTPAGTSPVFGPNGSYAFATSGSGVGQNRGSAGSGYTSDGIDVRGLRGPQADRYAAEVRQARAINQNQASRRGQASLTPQQERERKDMISALTTVMPGARGLTASQRNGLVNLSEQDARTKQVQTSAEATMYGSDNSLRGSEASAAATRYSADAQLGGRQMEVQQKLRQQQLVSTLWGAADGKPEVFQSLAMQYGLVDAAKQGGDMAGAQQTRAKANSEDAQSTFKGMFTRKGKDGPERDEHAEAQAHQLASQIVPGWENMSIEQRNANRAKVVDATRAVQGMNKMRNNGWLQAAGWDKPTPEYSQLPDLDGATIGDVGFLEGAARKDVGKNDTKITLRNGENRFIPAGTLSEAQLRMLQDNGATRSTR